MLSSFLQSFLNELAGKIYVAEDIYWRQIHIFRQYPLMYKFKYHNVFYFRLSGSLWSNEAGNRLLMGLLPDT